MCPVQVFDTLIKTIPYGTLPKGSKDKDIYIYICIYIQLPCGPSPPPCLRCSAWCGEAFCVVWGPLASTQDRQKSRKKTQTNCQNPFQKGSKIMKNRGLGGSWGPWGAVWGPSGPPGSPRTAQSRKRVEKAGSLTAPRDPKMDNFRYFFEFFCIILRCFFEAVFGRPWDLIFRGFWDDF